VRVRLIVSEFQVVGTYSVRECACPVRGQSDAGKVHESCVLLKINEFVRTFWDTQQYTSVR